MTDTTAADEPTARFEALRPRLFGLAYRMVASVQDAEDVVQDAWLRWPSAAGSSARIRSDEAWLVTTTTRLAIDRLRQLGARRESYVGSWLPEPLATPAPAPGADLAVESDLSFAFLLLLEHLAPEERAALLLRDVFDVPYADIAETLQRGESACRQMVHRARERLREDAPRRFTAPPDAQARLLDRFLAALHADDPRALLDVLADDAVFIADGGGRVQSVRNVVHGARRVARLVLGYERKGRGFLAHRVAWLNGEPAVVATVGGRVLFADVLESDGERVTTTYRVLNPDKLRHLDEARTLV